MPGAVVRFQHPRGFPPIHPGQRQVHQDQIGPQRKRLRDRFVAVAGFGHTEAGELEELGVHLPCILVIVDDENQRRVLLGHCSVSAGMVNMNVEPTPIALSRVIRPPSAVAKRRQIARPRPVPPYWRDGESSTCLKSSKIFSWCSGEIPMPESFTTTAAVRSA